MAKVSVVGTGTTYTFTVDTGAVPNAVQMYELSGADLNLALFVNHAAKTQTTASGSWTGIGTAAGSMVPAGYQALAFISGITTPTSGGTITPTFTGTYTTDSEVSGLNNCWIQPYHSTAPITVNTAVGLTAATIITPNAGMAINVLYGAASSGFMVNRQVSVDDTSTSRSPTFSQVGGAIVTGNLTVAQVQWAATSLVTFTTPANWTIIDNQPPIQTSNTPGVATLYCVATASVCTNVTTTWTNAFSAVTSYNIYAVEFFGQNTTTPIDGHSYVQTTSSAPLTLPTVTPVISGDTAVSMASDATASNAAPSGFTAFFLNNVQNGGSIAYNVGGAYKTGLTTSGISPNWDTSSVASSAADLVVVAPVSTPPPSSCASYIALVGVGC